METLTVPAPVGRHSELRRFWPRAAICLTLAVGFVVLGYSAIHRAAWSDHDRSDFTVYTAAAQTFLDGGDIYDADNSRGWLYMYLPIFAVLMVPFTWVNTAWAAGIWYAISVAMLLHVLWMSADLAKWIWPDTRATKFVLAMWALLGVMWPAISGLARGQASVLVAYLVTLGVWAAVRDRRWLAGAAIAGAIVLKVFPVLLLGYFLVKRRWSIVAATTVWLVLLVLVLPSFAFGTRENWTLLSRWMRTVAMPANTSGEAERFDRYKQMIDPRIRRNQSLQAVVVRIVARDEKTAEETGRGRLAETIGKTLSVLLLLVSGWACLRGGHTSQRPVVLHACLVIVLMLLISPVSWVHNYVLMALPLGVAAAIATDPLQRDRRTFQIALIIFIVGSLCTIAFAPLYRLGGLMWGAMAIWLAFAWLLLREQSGSQPEHPASEFAAGSGGG